MPEIQPAPSLSKLVTSRLDQDGVLVAEVGELACLANCLPMYVEKYLRGRGLRRQRGVWQLPSQAPKTTRAYCPSHKEINYLFRRGGETLVKKGKVIKVL